MRNYIFTQDGKPEDWGVQPEKGDELFCEEKDYYDEKVGCITIYVAMHECYEITLFNKKEWEALKEILEEVKDD